EYSAPNSRFHREPREWMEILFIPAASVFSSGGASASYIELLAYAIVPASSPLGRSPIGILAIPCRTIRLFDITDSRCNWARLRRESRHASADPRLPPGHLGVASRGSGGRCRAVGFRSAGAAPGQCRPRRRGAPRILPQADVARRRHAEN